MFDVKHKKPVVLLAEDDEQDAFLTRKAFLESGYIVDFRRVCNGEELMAYLVRKGEYENSDKSPRPSIILLDLNMPKMDGREVLTEIKLHPDFKKIPVIILSTSKFETDVSRSHILGANSYIAKPVELKELIEVIKRLSDYWFRTVELPE